MTVTMISTSGGHIAEVTGTGYNDQGEIELRAYKGRDLDIAKMGVYSMLEVCLLLIFTYRTRNINYLTSRCVTHVHLHMWQIIVVIFYEM